MKSLYIKIRVKRSWSEISEFQFWVTTAWQKKVRLKVAPLKGSVPKSGSDNHKICERFVFLNIDKMDFFGPEIPCWFIISTLTSLKMPLIMNLTNSFVIVKLKWSLSCLLTLFTYLCNTILFLNEYVNSFVTIIESKLKGNKNDQSIIYGLKFGSYHV